jgi:hypothetical protein
MARARQWRVYETTKDSNEQAMLHISTYVVQNLDTIKKQNLPRSISCCCLQERASAHVYH